MIDEEIEEDKEDNEAVGIQAGFSHERQKVHMYNSFTNMATSMRSFTLDIEKRLENVYKDGAQKKFGLDKRSEVGSVSSARSVNSDLDVVNEDESELNPDEIMKQIEKKIQKQHIQK